MRQSESETEKKHKSTKHCKEGQLVLIKNLNVRAFLPKYLADYRIIKVVNENTAKVVSPDGRERQCNIHHIKPISSAVAFTSTFVEFTECIKGDKTHFLTQSSVKRQPHITSGPL